MAAESSDARPATDRNLRVRASLVQLVASVVGAVAGTIVGCERFPFLLVDPVLGCAAGALIGLLLAGLVPAIVGLVRPARRGSSR